MVATYVTLSVVYNQLEPPLTELLEGVSWQGDSWQRGSWQGDFHTQPGLLLVQDKPGEAAGAPLVRVNLHRGELRMDLELSEISIRWDLFYQQRSAL